MRVGCQVAIVYAVTHGYLDSVPVEGVAAYENDLYLKLENEKADLLARFESGSFEPADVAELEATLQEMAR